MFTKIVTKRMATIAALAALAPRSPHAAAGRPDPAAGAPLPPPSTA
jgi:hypothetical protein